MNFSSVADVLIHFYSIDANDDEVMHQVERLPDGRKSISYEINVVGKLICVTARERIRFQ